MPVKTNRDRLVQTLVHGEVTAPWMPASLYDVGADGVPRVLPSVGGITLNVRVGDPAFGFDADHVEPAVSAAHPDEKINVGFCALACVGNSARVISGDARGERGVVTGKHGGVEHVMIDFRRDVMERMALGDRIAVHATGLGLEIAGAGDVRAFNVDPDLLERVAEVANGRVSIGVAREIPAAVMGSGLGRSTVVRGDYDIQCFDDVMVERYGLRELRLGDLVVIRDADNTHGRVYRSGAVTIAVVAHGASNIAGHGPGVTTLLTSASGRIDVRIDAAANVATLLALR